MCGEQDLVSGQPPPRNSDVRHPSGKRITLNQQIPPLLSMDEVRAFGIKLVAYALEKGSSTPLAQQYQTRTKKHIQIRRIKILTGGEFLPLCFSHGFLFAERDTTLNEEQNLCNSLLSDHGEFVRDLSKGQLSIFNFNRKSDIAVDTDTLNVRRAACRSICRVD